MNNFEFLNPTKIIFGKDVEEHVGKEVKKHSSSCLLHYGGGSIKKNGLYDRIVHSLKSEKIRFIELGGVQPNPRLSLVREGIKICRENDLNFVLAVGGGSVIDSAKAIAVGVPYSGDVWNFYSGEATPEKKLGVGSVLTIPAAGSEASHSSVITNEEGMLKRPLNMEMNRPSFTFMNPELTFTLSKYQTACGIADILSHVMERYFTNIKNVDFTDRLCEATMKTVINNAYIVSKNPKDYNARAEIMWASTIAHNNLLSTGRIGDFGSHFIEHELSSINDVAHGAGLAIIFPAWAKYVQEKLSEKFLQFAVRVWNIDQNFENPKETIMEGINRLESFFTFLGLPTKLKHIGIGEDNFNEIAVKTLYGRNGSVGNVVSLGKDDIINILKLAE
ncbi:NADH-dependent alcohol dehydrogenase [Marispirochaeta aestuarii]|uniref:NADH-dependent alcohol dehydrogenase n=1 Tax=Marispirochaeta aestuarii TaxID=1963862 RepID=A0A1Y1RSX8_9SPIO|nr:iron-containing alcohol dehydrogenase [Marispirochaeta aestuarii]ORC29900.1 NADH-dependent alcohol dehydrogenase [Marispirochaeta aestuarii]